MKQFHKILALLTAIFLLLTLTVLPAFADDDVVTTGEGETTETTGEEVTETTGETDGEAPATGADATAESKGLSTAAIIWIVVGGVVVVAGVVLCIVFREKVGKFFRVYKSEVKKIVWLPWNQTCKSTLVVLVILVVCAAAICLVDLGLSKGFLAFLKLFQK